MKKIYYFTIYFLKVFTTYKINFLALLVIPVIGVVYQKSEYIFQLVNLEGFYQYIAIWLSYMVTMSAFTIGHQVVMIREQQFLKQMKFVVKDYKVIIFSVILSQFIILIVTVMILTLTSTLLFKVPFLSLLLFSYGVVILPFIPLSFLTLIFNLLPIHAENLQPIITITTAAMLFFTNFIHLTERVSIFAIVVNPMHFALETGKIWTSLFLSSIPINYLGVVMALILYFIIGYYALKNTRINSNFRM